MTRRRVLLIAVTVAALVLVAPVLVEVYGELGDAITLSPWWLAAVVVAVAVQLLAHFQMRRMMLHTSRWLDVGAPALVGNAASHLVPGGGAVGAGVEARMLSTAGFSNARILTTFAAVTMIGTISGFVVLPLVVLAASAAGSEVDPELIAALWTGVAILLVALVAIAAAAVRNRPWHWLAVVISWGKRLLRRPGDVAGLEGRLLEERDHVLATIRGRAGRVLLVDLVRAGGDFVALYCALRATGAPVNPAAALAAFIVANLAGLIPLTPGGLGFVEAGLTGVLTVAGASATQANLTVATYRLGATWLPCVLAAFALAWFHRRHREQPVSALLSRPDPSSDPDALPGTPPTAASHTGSASSLPPDR